MSYRGVFFSLKKINREKINKFRKFQVSKYPTIVLTKPKTKLVEVPIDESTDEQ